MSASTAVAIGVAEDADLTSNLFANHSSVQAANAMKTEATASLPRVTSSNAPSITSIPEGQNATRSASAGELAEIRRRMLGADRGRIDRAGAEKQMAENAIVIRQLERRVEELMAELSSGSLPTLLVEGLPANGA